MWDLGLRLFHWTLTGVFVGSWVTSELGTDYRDLHMSFGYVMLGLLVFRLIWGFAGGQHARFMAFRLRPTAVWHHIRTLTDRTPVTEPGHNPLGALVVVLMLIGLLTQVITGLFTSDDIFTDGPYVATASNAVVKTMSSLHHSNFDILKLVVILHVLAIGYYGWWKKTNLVKPMLAAPTEAPKMLGRAIALALLSAGLAWLVVMAPELFF